MTEQIKLAWRNLWRNKRRTIITASSIFFAVLFAIVMRSYQLGAYDHWTNSAVEAFSGHMQVQLLEYWDEPTIDNAMPLSDDIIQSIKEIDKVKNVVPRIQMGALISTGNQTKGALVMGVDPEKENEIIGLENRLVKIQFTKEALNKLEKSGVPEDVMTELRKMTGKSFSSIGRLEVALNMISGANDYTDLIVETAQFENSYLKSDDDGVLIGDKLAQYLKVNVGDSIVLMSQGYHGVSAAGLYPVRGVVTFPLPKLNKMVVYMTLANAQQFFSAYNYDEQPLISSLAVTIEPHNDNDIEEVKKEILATTDSDVYTVKNWKELNVELVQQIESDNASGMMMIAMLYLIIAFGVLGTVLMMTAERKREFGVMVAVGMQKTKLGIIVLYEMLFVGILGIVAGAIASVPIVMYFTWNPIQLTGDVAKTMEDMGFDAIMPMAGLDWYYLNQSLVVVVIVTLAMIYPYISIRKLNTIKAIRGR